MIRSHRHDTTLWCIIRNMSIDYPPMRSFDVPKRWALEECNLSLSIEGIVLPDLDNDIKSRLESKLTLAMLTNSIKGDVLVYDDIVYNIIIEQLDSRSQYSEDMYVTLKSAIIEQIPVK